MTREVPRILHCHADFAQGENQELCATLINAFGQRVEHVVVSEKSGEIGSRDRIDKGVTARFPTSFPDISGKPSPRRLAKIAEALKEYDLICTYGWGAINVAFAHTMFAESLGLPPLIHHENGTDPHAPPERKIGRNWYRRIALGRTAALIVDSLAMEKLALEKWKQPRARVRRITPGLDPAAYAKKPKATGLRLVKRKGELWVGTIARMLAGQSVSEFIAAFREMPESWQLVIVGEVPEQDAIREAIAQLNVEHRVHMTGPVDAASKVLGLFDIFALPEPGGSFPRIVQQAMAAGLPIAAPDTAEIRRMLADENLPYLCATGGLSEMARSLKDLAGDPQARADVSAANRKKAKAEFTLAEMIERYRDVYSEAMGREF